MFSRNDLNHLIQTRANGAAIRSRARLVEFGEKILNIFLGWKNGIAVENRLYV